MTEKQICSVKFPIFLDGKNVLNDLVNRLIMEQLNTKIKRFL